MLKKLRLEPSLYPEHNIAAIPYQYEINFHNQLKARLLPKQVVTQILQEKTGQILAMVGSRDYFRDDIDGRVNNAIALNSPGSTLKPFTYATAFMQGWGPDWPIVDTPIKYKQPDGTDFEPRNPDGKSHGVIPLRIALGNSFNIPGIIGSKHMIATPGTAPNMNQKNAATGWNLTAEEYLRTGQRIQTLRQMFNIREC